MSSPRVPQVEEIPKVRCQEVAFRQKPAGLIKAIFAIGFLWEGEYYSLKTIPHLSLWVNLLFRSGYDCNGIKVAIKKTKYKWQQRIKIHT